MSLGEGVVVAIADFVILSSKFSSANSTFVNLGQFSSPTGITFKVGENLDDKVSLVS